jgi:hypothetical protein
VASAGLIALHDRLFGAWLRRRPRPDAPRGVLFVSSGGLGDTVLLAHVLPRFLRLAAAGEPATVLLRRDAAKMAFLFPPGTAVESVDYGRLLGSLAYRRRTFARLRGANFRRVVSLDYLRHPLLDEALIGACGAEAAAMEPRPWPKHDARLKANRALYARLYDSGPPVRDKVARWADYAGWLTGVREAPPIARLDAALLPPPAALPAPTVLIQPFSAVAAKQSRPALYRRLIEALPAGHRVRLLGAPGDIERNPEFAALLALPGVSFDGAGFAELVPTLRAAALVVSVDTALMHLAVAVGAPTLCLASAAYVGEIVPYAPEVAPPNMAVVYHDMPCRSCLGACRLPPEDGMFPCVARLDGDAAVAAALGLLAGGGP